MSIARAQLIPLPPRSSRSRTSVEVADYLRDLIMAGQLAHGHRLLIRELAANFGFSAMPVREALLQLASEGLVESHFHRSFRVARISAHDVEDVFELHATIAGRLTERAIDHLKPEDFAYLRDLDRQMQNAARSGATNMVEELNFQFHRRINLAARSLILSRFLAQVTRYVPRRFYAQIPDWVATSVPAHGPILDALEMGDSALARQLMEAHIRQAGTLLVDHLLGGQPPAPGAKSATSRKRTRTGPRRQALS